MTETTPERYTWIFTPAPDPREARIAELKARIAELELALSPEGDMAVTVEELDA